MFAAEPMGRLGTAEEIAALAVYLASDEKLVHDGIGDLIDGGGRVNGRTSSPAQRLRRCRGGGGAFAASREDGNALLSWFETRRNSALLTMRIRNKGPSP